VVYRGQNGHVYELWWNFDEGWHYNDLTTAAGAPLAGLDGAGGGDPIGYVFDADGTQHVHYVGDDKHIDELWWDGNWHHNDLTAASGGPSAYGHLTGYVFAAQSTRHVVYQSTDGPIQELWWDHGGWHHSDISAATSAPKSQTPPGGICLSRRALNMSYTRVMTTGTSTRFGGQHEGFTRAPCQWFLKEFDLSGFRQLLAGAGFSTGRPSHGQRPSPSNRGRAPLEPLHCAETRTCRTLRYQPSKFELSCMAMYFIVSAEDENLTKMGAGVFIATDS
jgi:hypothetical protein